MGLDCIVRLLVDVLAADLIFRRASGVRVGKGQYLDELMEPDNTYERLESKDVEASLRGNDVALVALCVEGSGSAQGCLAQWRAMGSDSIESENGV